MKKQIVIAILAAFGITKANAQTEKFWDKTAVEVSYGYAMPISPTANIEAKDYNSFKNFQGGINYNINELWGVRLSYAYQDFTNKNNSKLGVVYNKFMAEATFNITQALNNGSFYKNPNAFELLAHAGIGASFANRAMDNATNKMANAQIGLKPSYNLSNRVSIFLDATYVTNFNQAYEFSGTSIYGGTTGSYLAANVGVQVKLGK